MVVFGFVREGWRLGPQAARALIYCINKGKLLRRKGGSRQQRAQVLGKMLGEMDLLKDAACWTRAGKANSASRAQCNKAGRQRGRTTRGRPEWTKLIRGFGRLRTELVIAWLADGWTD